MNQPEAQRAVRRTDPAYAPSAAPISSREEAVALCAAIEATMEALLQMIEAETTLLRNDQTVAAAELESRQSHYARRYIDELGSIGAVGEQLDHFAPGSVARLRRLHEQFCSVLRIDMAALATARAASDARRPRVQPSPPRPVSTAPANRPPRDARLSRAASG